MTIDLLIILYMIIAAILGSVIYIVIGIIPGTDETSVLAPILLVLLKINLHPLVVLSFFIAAVVSLNTTDSIPTALTSIPGGVMSTPLVDASKELKEQGLTTQSLRKMTMGSLIGTITAFIFSLLFYLLFSIFAKNIDLNAFVKQYSSLIFFVGAILLSLLTKGRKNKIISLLAIVPFGIITGILSTNKVYNFNISIISFFLAITIGPLIYNLFTLLIPKNYQQSVVYGNMDLEIILDHNIKGRNLNILTKQEVNTTIISSLLASSTFFLSPVGMTLLIGDLTTNQIKDKTKQAFTKVTVMNGIANASYLAGIMISLLVFKFEISPAAFGPGKPLFDQTIGILNQATNFQFIIAITIGIIVALLIVIPLTLKYAEKMTFIVFKYISHEAVLALLFSLVFLLVFLDSNIVGVLLILIVSLISGLLHKNGVSYGVLFMALYASSFILGWFI